MEFHSVEDQIQQRLYQPRKPFFKIFNLKLCFYVISKKDPSNRRSTLHSVTNSKYILLKVEIAFCWKWKCLCQLATLIDVFGHNATKWVIFGMVGQHEAPSSLSKKAKISAIKGHHHTLFSGGRPLNPR